MTENATLLTVDTSLFAHVMDFAECVVRRIGLLLFTNLRRVINAAVRSQCLFIDHNNNLTSEYNTKNYTRKGDITTYFCSYPFFSIKFKVQLHC